MQKILKVKFQNVLSINILRRIIDVIKVKLCNYKNINEYTTFYCKPYDNICNLISENFEITIFAVNMIL